MRLVIAVMWLLPESILIGISIPLILGRIPPNDSYGFRVKKTLNDPDVWYPANRYAGWAMLWACVITLVVAIMLAFMPQVSLYVYSITCLAVFAVSIITSVVLSHMYLRRL